MLGGPMVPPSLKIFRLRLGGFLNGMVVTVYIFD